MKNLDLISKSNDLVTLKNLDRQYLINSCYLDVDWT